MAHHLAGIDHVLLPMPDSEAALRMYRRLGFLPTSLIDADDGVPVSHAFLFRRGYVAFAAGIGLDNYTIVYVNGAPEPSLVVRSSCGRPPQ